MTEIGDKFYTLRRDSNSKFPPYFGTEDIANTLIEFNYKQEDSTNVLITDDNLAIEQNLSAKLVSGAGGFKFKYVSPIAAGTPLLAGIPIKLIVKDKNVTFKYKDPSTEKKDIGKSSDKNYKPNYSGNVERMILVPVKSFPDGQCDKIDINGAIDSYLLPSSGRTFYTTQDFCKNKIINPACTTGKFCGGKIDGIDCYGPCSSGKPCAPDGEGKLTCAVLPAGLSITTIATIIAITVFVVAALIILITVIFGRKD